jgi:hypothetical protein
MESLQNRPRLVQASTNKLRCTHFSRLRTAFSLRASLLAVQTVFIDYRSAKGTNNQGKS